MCRMMGQLRNIAFPRMEDATFHSIALIPSNFLRFGSTLRIAIGHCRSPSSTILLWSGFPYMTSSSSAGRLVSLCTSWHPKGGHTIRNDDGLCHQCGLLSLSKTKNKQGGEQKSRYLHVTDLVVANVQHFEIGAFFQTVEAANVIVREP